MREKISGLILSFAVILFFFSLGAELYGDTDFIATIRKIRITDAIGRGTTREEAIRRALEDAKKKAKKRVTSAFGYLFAKVREGVVEEEDFSEKLHAEVIGEPRILKESWPFNDVVILDCIVTVKFLDLDFFVEEAKKTAEGACIRSLVLSGWGQAYNRNYLQGLIQFFVTYGSLAYGAYSEKKYYDMMDKYKTAKSPYLAETYKRKAESYDRLRYGFYTAAFISWLYGIWDAFEDRKRASQRLDEIHNKYFKEIPYKTTDSFLQELMYDTIPSW